MILHRFITIITATCLINACAAVEPAKHKAVRDEQQALGMVLVEHEGQKLLKLIVCAVQDEQLPEGGQLADETLCPNAFVDADGNGYYFSELQPQGVKQGLRTRGYLKLGSLLLVPLALGTLVGWKARPLVKRLKLIITDEGKPVIDRGARNSKHVAQAKQAQDEALADVRTNTKVGLAGGTIMAIVSLHRLHKHVWGKSERLTVAHWDDIFRTHLSFSDAKLLPDNTAITRILTTLAQELNLTVNPAVIAQQQ